MHAAGSSNLQLWIETRGAPSCIVVGIALPAGWHNTLVQDNLLALVRLTGWERSQFHATWLVRASSLLAVAERDGGVADVPGE